jgi:hypothetical protein
MGFDVMPMVELDVPLAIGVPLEIGIERRSKYSTRLDVSVGPVGGPDVT